MLSEEEEDLEAGLDFRWRPSSVFGVDLTANPDFALVEADVETINLTRFELFVPEKRPFFLEGNELYSQRIRQFYSRRIGDITWGAKTNGKLGRADFSAIVTSERLALDETGANGPTDERADYGVVRIQHGLPRGSNVGLLLGNRRLSGDDSGSMGLDTTLFFTDRIGFTGQYLRVHGPTSDGGSAWFLRPAYDSANTHFHVRYTNLDENILDDVNSIGFLRDDNRREVDTALRHDFWFTGRRLEKIDAGFNYNRFWGQDGELRSWELDAEVGVVMRGGWEVELEHVEDLQVFEKEFRNELTELTGGWDGRDGRQLFGSIGTGVNFDNDIQLYELKAAWPFGDRWRLGYSLTRLQVDPDPDNRETWIHVFETNYTFSPDLFVRLFVQSNSAIDKENIQLLGVWRFNPPFGSLQVAYQTGTSELGQRSDQGDTLFTKLSWVF